MKKPHLYLGLCTEFFDLEKPFPAIEEYSFYLSYIQQTQGPVLEPMCGSGRYLIPYVCSGYRIEGFDASPFMLKALHEKSFAKNIHPIVWEQFLEDAYKKDILYRLIFIPDSSFCLFLERQLIIKCLQNIYAMLSDDGIFVFDVETIYSIPAYPEVWQGKAYKKENGQLLIQSTLPLEVIHNEATVICKYELVEETNIIHTEIEHFKIKLYEPREMDSLLQEVGFKTIKRIKAYNKEQEPSAHDYTIVYECRK